jgi:hypothetical protein
MGNPILSGCSTMLNIWIFVIPYQTMIFKVDDTGAAWDIFGKISFKKYF